MHINKQLWNLLIKKPLTSLSGITLVGLVLGDVIVIKFTVSQKQFKEINFKHWKPQDTSYDGMHPEVNLIIWWQF